MRIRVVQHPSEARFVRCGTHPTTPESTPPFSYTTTEYNYAATDCGSAHRRHAGDRSTTVLGGVPYYGMRYYNPSLGRWVSRDCLWERASLNLFGFLYNSPLIFVDEFGCRGFMPVGLPGAVIEHPNVDIPDLPRPGITEPDNGPATVLIPIDIGSTIGGLTRSLGGVSLIGIVIVEGYNFRGVPPIPSPDPKRYEPIGEQRPETSEAPSGSCDPLENELGEPKRFYTRCTKWQTKPDQNKQASTGAIIVFEFSVCDYSKCSCICNFDTGGYSWDCESGGQKTFNRRAVH